MKTPGKMEEWKNGRMESWNDAHRIRSCIIPTFHHSAIPAFPRSPRAFTLIEILIVITIIAALVTLAVPATNSILARSRAARCMGNLKNIGAALNLYLADHNNTMPVLVMARESKDDSQPALETVLAEYAGSPAVFHCEADTKHLFETTGSSYLWNSLLNGQNVASLEFMGFVKNSSGIPVVSDKENFHKYRDPQVNILYADGHVAKEIQFVVRGK
jgi:prepilin-type N-terminal cleavage/methylation domain-containing protein/prepilin-type processing-associated H-X9-DG protein